MTTKFNIPNGSTINTAYLTVTSRANTTDDNVQLKVNVENTDDAVAPTSFSDYNDKVTTTGVDWDFSDDWTAGTSYNSPDISTEIQTVVNRAGWVSGNDINLFVEVIPYLAVFVAIVTAIAAS